VVTGKLGVREAAARLPDEADEPKVLQDTGTPTESDNDTDKADLDAVPDEAEA
jgi:type I restriction enzyme, S subunit